MNIFLENVNINSTSGPNYFGKKLVKYMELRGVQFNDRLEYDRKLTFIESIGQRQELPMFQRLDGIYFNANFDCDRMNSNIKRTYEKANGVIFQTEFNKNLIFNWFGKHDNFVVINNGADILHINDISPNHSKLAKKLSAFEKVWSCAASWHSFKRLKDNVQYFLQFSKQNDCLVVAGPNPDYVIDDPRIFYVGNLDTDQLLSLFKLSDIFIHLAYLDHCPNVVVDARACGCKVICSSSGGTREIAGTDAIIIQEPDWDYGFLNIKKPPKIDYNLQIKNTIESNISMNVAAKKYIKFLKDIR